VESLDEHQDDEVDFLSHDSVSLCQEPS